MTAGLDTLASLVQSTQAASVTRQALLLKLDRLPIPLRRPHHRRLALAALSPLLDADRGCLHELPAGRLAVSWRGDSPANLGRVMAALGHLLLDAPAGTPSLGSLTCLFHLPQDGPALLAAAKEGADPSDAHHAPRDTAVARATPLDLATLARLEAVLAQADVERFVRRRPVCALTSAGLSLAWDERVLDLDEIAAELTPGRSITADPGILRRLCRTLDQRMLALLARSGTLDRARPFGLRLGVESLISAWFLRFDAALPARLRGKVVVGVAPADVLDDPATFAFARDFARGRGYRVMLREVSANLLPVLALTRLDLDLVQIDWDCAIPNDPANIDGIRLVVGGADDPAALDWARAHGAAYVQGQAALLAA